MAAKTQTTAALGCIIAGCLGLAVGTPFSLIGAVTRYYYGPDSIYAKFEADTRRPGPNPNFGALF